MKRLQPLLPSSEPQLLTKYNRDRHNLMVETSPFNFDFNRKTTYGVAQWSAVKVGAISLQKKPKKYKIASEYTSPSHSRHSSFNKFLDRSTSPSSHAASRVYSHLEKAGISTFPSMTGLDKSEPTRETYTLLPQRAENTLPPSSMNFGKGSRPNLLLNLMHKHEEDVIKEIFMETPAESPKKDQENISPTFKIDLPILSNERHMENILLKRKYNLTKMSVDESLEPALYLKKHILTSTPSSPAPLKNRKPKAGSGIATDEQFSKYVYVIVFDRVIFAGSNVITSALFSKPITQLQFAKLKEQAIKKFALNKTYNLLLDKKGNELSSLSELLPQNVVLLTNDPGLKPFLQEYGSKNSLGSATPFGLSRKKIELLFFKIDTLEKSLHNSPAFAGTSINAPQMESNSTMPLLDSAEDKHGIEKVLRAIEGDRGALTSHNAQELCTLISDDREFFISNLDKSMAYMARDYKMKAKKIPKQYSSVEQYVESSDYILPTPELDKISLLIDIYDRLIKGADLDEVGAVSDLQNNFERLGEILNIPPDEKQIIGGTKHSNATRSRMLGLVLQEVFNRYYNGKLEVKTTTQEVPLPANEEFPVHKKTDFIERNRVNVASLRRAAMDSQKNAVRMVESNIPMMEADLGFSRFELFSFFVLFKALSVVSSQVRQPDGDFITDGCLYEIWRRGVGRLSTMSDNLAYKIYIKIDESMEGILDWREFLKGMQLLNAQTKIDMIDLFLKLADSRRTGFLSFEELRELAQLTLLRYLKISDNRFFKSIAEYFTKLIFEITETPLDQLIELVKIKEKILEVDQTANLG